MPLLRHLDKSQQKINRRVTKALLKQYSQDLPDNPLTTSAKEGFDKLMTSLQYILILFDEIDQDRSIYARKRGYLEEEEEDSDEGSDSGSDDGSASSVSGSTLSGFYRYPHSVQSSRGSTLSGFLPRSLRSGSLGSSVYSAPISASLGSRAPSSASSASSVSSAPSSLTNPTNFTARKQNIPYLSETGIISQLLREIITATSAYKSIEGQIPLLDKIKKVNLRKTLDAIAQKYSVIHSDTAYSHDEDLSDRLRPFGTRFEKLYKAIEGELRQSEGASLQQIPSFERGTPDPNAEGAGRISGSTMSVFGAGRKHRLLSPAMYKAHNGMIYPNVNQLFLHNLEKRNR
jgi:hypothetical protein